MTMKAMRKTLLDYCKKNDLGWGEVFGTEAQAEFDAVLFKKLGHDCHEDTNYKKLVKLTESKTLLLPLV